jgi:hypothetical protein
MNLRQYSIWYDDDCGEYAYLDSYHEDSASRWMKVVYFSDKKMISISLWGFNEAFHLVWEDKTRPIIGYSGEHHED